MGAAWCGEVADAEAALEHSSQAVRYLLVGKDDCVRKATKVCPVFIVPCIPRCGLAAASCVHSMAATAVFVYACRFRKTVLFSTVDLFACFSLRWGFTQGMWVGADSGL